MADLPRIKSSNLWDQAYNILKEHIISRKFKPNEKLSITDLVNKLGISNTPIRDALIRLEMEQLVRTVSKVGTYVNPINAENVIHTMDTRLMLEYWVADRVPAVSKSFLDESLSKMNTIMQNAMKRIDSLDLDQFVRYDYNFKFHIEYMKMGQNPQNVEIYSNLMNYRHILIGTSIESYESKHAAIQQHQTIIDAVRDGTVSDIKNTVLIHLDGSKARLLQLIEENGGVI